MTKTKRVILLVTNILTLLAAIFAFLYFATAFTVLSRSRNWSDLPSLSKIQTSEDIYFLRSTAEDAREKLLADYEALNAGKWFILIFSGFLFVSSIVHFCFTPWKLREQKLNNLH